MEENYSYLLLMDPETVLGNFSNLFKIPHGINCRLDI